MTSTDEPETSGLRPDGTVVPPVTPDPPDPPGYQSPVEEGSVLADLTVTDASATATDPSTTNEPPD